MRVDLCHAFSSYLSAGAMPAWVGSSDEGMCSILTSTPPNSRTYCMTHPTLKTANRPLGPALNSFLASIFLICTSPASIPRSPGRMLTERYSSVCRIQKAFGLGIPPLTVFGRQYHATRSRRLTSIMVHIALLTSGMIFLSMSSGVTVPDSRDLKCPVSTSLDA